MCVSVHIRVCLVLFFTEPADWMVRKQRLKAKVIGQKSENSAC